MILVKSTRDSNLANEVSAKEPFLLDHINPGAAGFQKNANNLLNSSLRTVNQMFNENVEKVSTYGINVINVINKSSLGIG